MGKEIFDDYEVGNNWLVCIDSDGCVFDTMEIKHKECFCPAMIKHWGLQPISKYARLAWEFENLYSKDRGLSRFITLYRSIELLKDWDEVKEYNFEFPDTRALERWLKEAPVTNNASLEKSSDPVLQRTLAWSLESNARIADMVYGIPPFPNAAKAIATLSRYADIIVVSATAREALEREWRESGLLPQYVYDICSQDEGTKKECIEWLKGYYAKDHVLMIGDAPGDMKAAHDNGVLFYPIRPGDEISSWREFNERYMDEFLKGTYRAKSEAGLIERFDRCLPVLPPWKLEKSKAN